MTYNGTVQGTPTFAAAKFANGLTAVSDANYISLPSGLFNFGATANWCIEAQLKGGAVASKIAVGSNAPNAIWLGTTETGTFCGSVDGSGGFATLILDSGVDATDGNWHHVAMVMTGGTSLSIFVDGALENTATGVFASPGAAAGAIGVFPALGGGYSWPGAIDEVAFWNAAKYTGAYSVPAAAYAGTEANLRALYHLEADGTDSTRKCVRVDATAGGRALMVLVPNANALKPYTGTAVPLIMYHSGSGEDQTALVSDSLKTTTVDALLDAGYILCGIAAGSSNWGNQAAVDAYADLYTYMVANYNLAKIGFLSQSMGGLTGLLCLNQGNVPNVAAWAGIYPACNLATIYADGMFTSAINTAYDCDAGTYAAKTAGHDPCLLNGNSFRNARIRFYASAGDTTVPKDDNTDTFQALVAAYVPESTIIVCTGEHGDSSHFQPADLVEFYNRALLGQIKVVLQPDATAGQDALIASDNPTWNWGTFDKLYVGGYGTEGTKHRIAIKFDLSAIPDNAVIVSAALSIYFTEFKPGQTGTDTMRVYRLKRAWIEGTRGAANDNPATGITWNRYDTTNNWSTAGGFHADDCEQVAIGSLAFGATDTLPAFKTWTLTAATKADLDSGNGWLIKGDAEYDCSYNGPSSDYATAAQRPKVTLEYTLAGSGGIFADSIFHSSIYGRVIVR